MFIQAGELAPSFFRTSEGWSLVGKSLFNIFSPLPSGLRSCLEHKINRLVLPWGMLHEEVVVKKATSIRQILNRAKLLLSKTNGVLYIIPPMERQNTPLEQELLKHYGDIFKHSSIVIGESIRMHHYQIFRWPMNFLLSYWVRRVGFIRFNLKGTLLVTRIASLGAATSTVHCNSTTLTSWNTLVHTLC